MSNNETHFSEPWASAFRRVGAVNPRTGEPSLRQLAAMTGVHATSLSRIIGGPTQKPDAEIVAKIAAALEVDFSTVARWLGLKWERFEQWVPPKEAALLTRTQREALAALILSIVNLPEPSEFPSYGR